MTWNVVQNYKDIFSSIIADAVSADGEQKERYRYERTQEGSEQRMKTLPPVRKSCNEKDRHLLGISGAGGQHATSSSMSPGVAASGGFAWNPLTDRIWDKSGAVCNPMGMRNRSCFMRFRVGSFHKLQVCLAVCRLILLEVPYLSHAFVLPGFSFRPI